MDVPQHVKRLTRSIHATFESFLAGQFALFGALCAFYGLSARFFLVFAVSTACFHGFVLVVLMQFRADFVNVETGERLERVNLANRITLARLSTLPTILFLLVAWNDKPVAVPVAALVAAVFLTDFIDGYISRSRHEVTRIGKILDSVSDYSLLFFVAIALLYLGVIPWWFFAILAGRLATQTVLMAVLRLTRGSIEPKSSLWGKGAVASTMLVFGFDILKRLLGSTSDMPYLGIEIGGATVVFVSVFDKIAIFLRNFRTGAEPVRSGSGAAAKE